jgi:hypothetical protein
MDTQKNDILDDALAVWREASRDETLSRDARTTLFNEVRSMGQGSGGVFVPGLSPAWRWAFLSSVPVVALTALLLVNADHRKPSAEPRLSAAKIDGQLVFTLANGKTEHLIYRSTDPQTFGGSTPVKMAANRYTEVATGGPTLVFYRID